AEREGNRLQQQYLCGTPLNALTRAGRPAAPRGECVARWPPVALSRPPGRADDYPSLLRYHLELHRGRSPAVVVPLSFGFRLTFFGKRKQPGVDVIGHGLEPGVADRLAIHSGHVRHFMTHDEVNGRLVFRFIGDGSEGMAEGVETKPRPTVDLQRPQKLGGLLRDGTIVG